MGEAFLVRHGGGKPIAEFVAGNRYPLYFKPAFSVLGLYDAKRIELLMKRSGTVRVSYALQKGSGASYAMAQIYINDQPVGIERTIKDNDIHFYQENIAVNTGDLFQFRAGSNGSIYYTYIRYFGITIEQEMPYVEVLLEPS